MAAVIAAFSGTQQTQASATRQVSRWGRAKKSHKSFAASPSLGSNESLDLSHGTSSSDLQRIHSNVSNGERFKGRRIYVAFRVIQVGEIREREQCFKARFDMFVEWHDPSAAKLKLEEIETYRMRHWEPEIRFSNADEFVELKRIYKNFPETGFIGFRSTVQGVFRVHFDLKSFPFDVQKLAVEITLGRERGTRELLHADKVQIRDSHNHPNVIMKQVSAEWQFRPMLYRLKKTTALEGVDGHSMSQYQLVIPIRRLCSYYLYNAYFVSAVIQILGFGVYAIDVNDVGSRTILTATLLVVLLALKFTIAAHQPIIAYNTHLDMFLVSSIVTLSLQYLQASLIHIFMKHADQSLKEEWDQALCISITVVFFVTQIYFLATALHARWSHHQKFASMGIMDDELWQLLLDQGYTFKNGDFVGVLDFDDRDDVLYESDSDAEDEGGKVDQEVNLARRNTWVRRMTASRIMGRSRQTPPGTRKRNSNESSRGSSSNGLSPMNILNLKPVEEKPLEGPWMVQDLEGPFSSSGTANGAISQTMTSVIPEEGGGKDEDNSASTEVR